MKAEHRLKLYKEALWHYRLSNWFPFLRELLRTDSGFCRYFWGKANFSHLVELKYLEPHNHHGYWYPQGETKPRIKLLKQAIKNLQKSEN